MTRSFYTVLVTSCVFILFSGICIPRNFSRDFQFITFGLGPNTLEASASGSERITVLAPLHEMQYAKVPSMNGSEISIGLEHDLLVEFARQHRKKIEFIPFENAVDAESAFLNGKGDLLLGRWSRSRHTADWIETVPFENSKLSLFCSDWKKPKTSPSKKRNVLSKKNVTLHVDHRHFFSFLRAARPTKENKKLKISYEPVTALFQRLDQHDEACALVDEREGDFENKFFPSIKKIKTEKKKLPLVWRVQSEQKKLQLELNKWITQQRKKATLSRHHSRYTSSLNALVPSDIRQLRSNILNRLPEFEILFQKSATSRKIPWTLLAAVGYQESHWDNSAVSPTKVRGIMQITRPTAQFLGITDILDVEQTIPGGARYLEYLSSLWPSDLPHRELLKMTLISYNLGFQHVRDCQQWLIEKKLDPFSWHNLEIALKAKADPLRSFEFKWGYARGFEAIHFAERVLSFETFLRRVLDHEILLAEQ